MARFGKTPEAERLMDRADIDSHGTRISYEGALGQFIDHLRESGYTGSVRDVPADRVHEFLESRGEFVTQSTLDKDRQSITAVTGETYDRIRSEKAPGRLSEASRAYTPEQTAAVQQFQSASHALSTQIAQEAGLRAHELNTLTPTAERGPTPDRAWSENRFAAREQQVTYTVQGKGGLVREVSITQETAQRLEQHRLEQPQAVIDRGISYQSHYTIPGGQAWSQSVSAASQTAFGWSNGAHGFRHGYAQDRMQELREAGYSRAESLQLVSQEMGHFRPEITETYLR